MSRHLPLRGIQPSALSTLSGRPLPGTRPPVSAHVPVLVHVGLHQVVHLHRVDLPALAVADLEGIATVTQMSLSVTKPWGPASRGTGP